MLTDLRKLIINIKELTMTMLKILTLFSYSGAYMF